MKDISNILAQFTPISLSEMDSVALLNRVDTKFMLSLGQLKQMLPKLSEFYDTLEVDGARINSYQTDYFDTDDLSTYKMHHNQKNPRYKVRIRKYIESNLTFLEFKEKIKGKTVKRRKKISDITEGLNLKNSDWISNYLKSDDQKLSRSLTNTFRRCTLVNKDKTERLTIDISLHFKDKKSDINIEPMVIAELKQVKLNRSSYFFRYAKRLGIRPLRMSKYCLGIMLVRPNIKHNRFKIKLNKLKSLDYYDAA